MSSTFGNNIKVSIFGQSHSKAIGVTIDGLPAGIKIDLDKLQTFLNRRAPGNAKFATSRKEPDAPEFLSGLVNNTTCGAPLTAVIYNQNAHSSDYNNIVELVKQFDAINVRNKKDNKVVVAVGMAKYSGDRSVGAVFGRADKNMYSNKKLLKTEKI